MTAPNRVAPVAAASAPDTSSVAVGYLLSTDTCGRALCETLPSIDHIRRPTLDVRKRAEIHQPHRRTSPKRCTPMTRRRSSGRCSAARSSGASSMPTTCSGTSTAFGGRQPGRPGEPPLPPVCDDPIGLHGRRLRTDVPGHPADATGGSSLPELHSLVHLTATPSAVARPGKALADAMALEVRQRRARRPSRGHYQIDPRYRPLRRRRSSATAIAQPDRSAAPLVSGAMVAGRAGPRLEDSSRR